MHAMSRFSHRFSWALALVLGSCAADPDPVPAADPAPSDDPAQYTIDSSVSYEIAASEPRWVVPSAALPADIDLLASNANVDIELFGGRLFMAWRTAPFHFASDETRMLIASSKDDGATFELEHTIEMGSDVREPRFLAMAGQLQLIWFQGGVDALAFQPVKMWRSFRGADGRWTDAEVLVDEPEVPWDIKVRDGVAYMTSYIGDHYKDDETAVLNVRFKRSFETLVWEPVDGVESVYEGGVSEVAFEFDVDGTLWAVTRNEDGDDSGWGSHVCTAPADALAVWDCPEQSSPERYDSPELFRHGDEIYLAARRDVYEVSGPDASGPFGDEGGLLLPYSFRPKRTALYRIDKASRSVVHLMDLPGAGDTAFPSVRRTGPHTFLMANYSSPLDAPDIAWAEGQASEEGTSIYLLTLSFSAEP